MANKDHVQRSDANKRSCQNCVHNHIKFSEFPCSHCKGITDFHMLDYTKPAVLTGKDLGYRKVPVKEETKKFICYGKKYGCGTPCTLTLSKNDTDPSSCPFSKYLNPAWEEMK